MKNIILVTFFTFSFYFAFSQDDAKGIEYDYITITVDSRSPRDAYISYSSGKFEELRVEASGKFDYSGVLKIINEKEKQGFELFSNAFSVFGGNPGLAHNYFLLRKRKN